MYSSHLFPIHIIYELIYPIIREPGPRYNWVGKSLIKLLKQLFFTYMYVIIFAITDSGANAISKTTKDTCSSKPIAICSQSSTSSSGMFKYILEMLLN